MRPKVTISGGRTEPMQKFAKSPNSLLSTGLFKDYAASQLNQYLKWFNSPSQVAAREKSHQAWLAKSWHKRAKIKLSNRLRTARTKLGEIIAGRNFED